MRRRRGVLVFRYEPTTRIDKFEWCLYTMMVFCVSLVGLLFWDNFPGKACANDMEIVAPTGETNSKSTKPRRKRNGSASPALAQPVVTSHKNSEQSGTGATSPASQETGDEHVAPSNKKQPVPETKPGTHVEEVNIGPVAWYFESLPPAGVAEKGIAIHSGSDLGLVKKLTVEMRKQDINISPFSGSLAANHVAVSWKIIREQAAVTVEATLTANGDSQSLSARSAGSYREQACDQAVRSAVSKVFAAMKNMSHNESTSSEF